VALLKSRAQELTAAYEPGAEEGDSERLLTDATRGDSTCLREDIGGRLVHRRPYPGDATPVYEHDWHLGPQEADKMTEAVGG
jgi:hypothetical protein